jgi:fructoselysine-6-P-deglycase FrlB-like protein
MDEMVASEPSLVSEIFADPGGAKAIAEVVARAAQQEMPIAVIGCGTSETAAMAVAALLASALRRPDVKPSLVHSRQALEAALDPWPGGVCLAITHDGGTRATLLAMELARGVGATTALITARSQSAAVNRADHVFVTPRIDRSWCHSVGYLSPILAGAAIAEALRPAGLDPTALRGYLDGVLGLRPKAGGIAKALGESERIVVVAAEEDLSPAKELALKIEEGVRLPARMLELETLLHGHLASCDERTGLVLIATGGPGRALKRGELALRAARRIGMPVAVIASPAVDASLDASSTNAGRCVLPDAVDRLGLIGRLAGAALCLQQLTLELAALKGTNPDLIRREQPAYREASQIAESATWW